MTKKHAVRSTAVAVTLVVASTLLAVGISATTPIVGQAQVTTTAAPANFFTWFLCFFFRVGCTGTTTTTRPATTTTRPGTTTTLPSGGGTTKGPAPTEASVTAATGPFAIAQTIVPAGNGFGGGTIYYPTDTTQGTFGALAVVPGFLGPQFSIAWYGPRIASQGFVVITIDTLTLGDQPNQRGDQLLAALTYVTNASSVASRVDRNRLAVMGHSMGGGGSLEAANKNKALKAAIPLAGWNPVSSWPGIVSPTLVVACQNDTIAANATHSTPFYNGLTTEKALVEITGGDHMCVMNPNNTIARQVISWLKRWVDNDTRYNQFLCPAPPVGGPISRSLSTCPF